MTHLEVHAAERRGTALADRVEDGAADDVARRALAARVVARHETLALRIQQVAAGAAQAFLQHRSGHARIRPRQQAGRVELHHLHVAEREAGPQRHGHAVARLVARRRVIPVHGRPAAGREKHGACLNEHEIARPHVDEQHAGNGVAMRRPDQFDRPMLFQPVDAAGPYLFSEPVDDLDPGQVALVDGPVEGLAGEGLLMDGAVGIAVEEAAEFVLELADARLGDRDQHPGEILVVEPLTALDRVHEMAFDRIPGASATL